MFFPQWKSRRVATTFDIYDLSERKVSQTAEVDARECVCESESEREREREKGRKANARNAFAERKSRVRGGLRGERAARARKRNVQVTEKRVNWVTRLVSSTRLKHPLAA